MPKSSKEKGLTKAQMVAEIASSVGISKSQVNDVFVTLLQLIEKELKGNRPSVIPGLVKITIKRKMQFLCIFNLKNDPTKLSP